MTLFKRIQRELSDPFPSSMFYRESAFWRSPSPIAGDDDQLGLGFALDFLCPSAAFDLPFARFQEELVLQSLSDRVTALELGLAPKPEVDRKYKWTAEFQGPESDKKYKWTAEMKHGEERSMKLTAEIAGKGKASRRYTFETSTAPPAGEKKGKGKETEKKKKDAGPAARVVEIEDEPNPGAVAIRKAFTKSAVNHTKGKKKQLSPQEAALLIQMTFRVHLVRRAQVLRGLRDLAVAKAKLKEIRALFYNFSYRRRITNDAEEHQRFSEKIIVLLLTVDAIEGPDYMVRAAKKSIIEELEAMLQVVDPQPCGKLGSMRRRKFSLPEGGTISKEISAGVAEVVQMIEQED